LAKKSRKGRLYSRRAFLSTAVVVPVLVAHRPSKGAAGRGDMEIASPAGSVRFQLSRASSGQLSYSVALKGGPVIEASRLGMTLDGVDLGQGFEVLRVERYRLRESYASRGVHSEAVNHCHGAKVFARHSESKTDYLIEVRAFDDGIAFRLIVPGEGRRRVPDEATAFTIPAGSTVWFHDFEGHYEGIHKRRSIAEVTEGEWAAPPLTVQLPGGRGFAAITEAALMNYSGMGLQATGQRSFKARLGHSHPVSHPFDLRYGAEEARRLCVPAAIEGEITTPWRVVIVGESLNALVNCDIICNVSPPPDRRLFPAGPQTRWIRPGRAVWKYLDGGDSTLEGMKEFSRLAGQLGFEHNIVEGFWHRWSEAEMRELIEYSRQQKVSVWFWEHSKNLRTVGAREKFFKLCEQTGVVGAKIDFFDHEAKEIIDLYQALLRDAAEHHLMLEFHGANKPAGEARTWPNELTREAVRGLEYRSMPLRATHNTTLPFTRLLAGHADYTPLHFGERRRETSWAHQIASAVIFTSPLMIYGAHPKSILENPAVELIKSIPSVWDETVVLPVSGIGEIAAFARRTGTRWFLAVMNGATARSVRLPLSFLGRGKHRGLLVRDEPENPAAVRIENSVVRRTEQLAIEMRAGGGFVARFLSGV
jgi:alpha-glucosidase